jgi:hypothetical protein
MNELREEKFSIQSFKGTKVQRPIYKGLFDPLSLGILVLKFHLPCTFI